MNKPRFIAWPPSRYRVRAITDAIMAAMTRAATPISRQTANTIAIAAMQADRRVVIEMNYGRRHEERDGGAASE